MEQYIPGKGDGWVGGWVDVVMGGAKGGRVVVILRFPFPMCSRVDRGGRTIWRDQL